MPGSIDSERTLAELVLEQPGRARVFEELQLDYCCGGERSLVAAAAQDGLDLRTLILALEAQERAFGTGQAERDWQDVSLAELCDHIVDEHHALLRRELPNVDKLLVKVSSRHGQTVPELNELKAVFNGLQGELIAHIDQEEEGLFPLCRDLVEGTDAQAAAISQEMEAHEAAHKAVGHTLLKMRELAGDYRPEQALCTTYGVMLKSLHDLERDLHQHLHEENNVLFPRLRDHLATAPAPGL